MAIGTVFTLLVIPSIYVLLAKQHAGEEPGAIARDFDETEAASHGVPHGGSHDETETPVFDGEAAVNAVTTVGCAELYDRSQSQVQDLNALNTCCAAVEAREFP